MAASGGADRGEGQQVLQTLGLVFPSCTADVQAAVQAAMTAPLASLPPAPAAPAVPDFASLEGIEDKLEAVQGVIDALQYNHTGKAFCSPRKDRGLNGVVSLVRPSDLRLAFLTHAHSGLPAHGELPTFQQGLWRLPLRFKSTVLGKDGACHRHIVLAVRLPSGKWGALGISRRAALGAKPFAFAALSDLLWDYALAYRDAGHALIKAYVGLPLPDGLPSHAALNWRGAAVRFPRDWLPPPHMPLHTPTLHRGHWSECAKPILDNFEACAEDLSTIWAARGRLKGSQVAAFRTRHWEAQEYSGQASVPVGAGSSSSDKVSGEAP